MLELFVFFLVAAFSDTLANMLHVSTQSMNTVVLILGMGLLAHLYFLSAPYVPTARKQIGIMLKFADIGTGDMVYDIGSGDGRILRAAADQHAARFIGFEISWILVAVSVVWNQFVGKDIDIRARDFWKHDFSDADVIFCFLLPEAMERIEREIWPKLKPGTRLVSRAFSVKNIQKNAEMDGVFLYIKE